MKTEIIINVTSYESRVAILEDNRLVELFVERPYHLRLLGNIYKGVVQNILPNLQAAFVDIGMDKNAFLHVSDMTGFPDADSEEEIDTGFKIPYGRKKIFPPIETLLKVGQEIMVQIIKEPISTKGCRVSTNINVPGRFLVLLFNSRKIGISRKIADKSERYRLRSIVSKLKPNDLGFIIRTASLDKSANYLEKDLKQLLKIYDTIQKTNNTKRGPLLLYREVDLLSSVIRDLFTPDVHAVVVDDKKQYQEIAKYLRFLKSELLDRVYYYRDTRPIFDNYHIEDDINQMLGKKVWLRRGGYLIIEQTEALISIDVNSGGFVKGENADDFILSLNLEAAREIARQLRLRDIGGLIIIDFIDMMNRNHRDKVFFELRNAMRRDRAKFFILNFSEFGLIEITRQRVRPSLLFSFSIECPICKGLGRIDSPLTTVSKIEHWFLRACNWLEDKKFTIKISPVVHDFIHHEDQGKFKEIEKRMRIEMIFEIDEELEANNFKVFSFRTGQDITDQFMNDGI